MKGLVEVIETLLGILPRPEHLDEFFAMHLPRRLVQRLERQQFNESFRLAPSPPRLVYWNAVYQHAERAK